MFRCGHYLCFCYDIYATAKCVRAVIGWLGSRYSPAAGCCKYLYDICEEEQPHQPAPAQQPKNTTISRVCVCVRAFFFFARGFGLIRVDTNMCAGCSATFSIRIRSHKVAPVTHRTRDPMIYVLEYILQYFFFSSLVAYSRQCESV